eukprot:753378-Hanusia_phi.AAC.1
MRLHGLELPPIPAPAPAPAPAPWATRKTGGGAWSAAAREEEERGGRRRQAGRAGGGRGMKDKPIGGRSEVDLRSSSGGGRRYRCFPPVAQGLSPRTGSSPTPAIAPRLLLSPIAESFPPLPLTLHPCRPEPFSIPSSHSLVLPRLSSPLPPPPVRPPPDEGQPQHTAARFLVLSSPHISRPPHASRTARGRRPRAASA